MSSSDIEDQVIALTDWMNQHRFGKYRGTVDSVGTDDNLGIIAVKMHDVFGPDLVIERVRPCVPFAGSKHGFVAIPEEGDGVWIEFEAGNPSAPIWTGFWWADGEIPEPKGPLVRSFITTKGHKLVLNDDANNVQLLHAGGAEITMTDSDITIKIGDSSIKLSKSDITLQAGAVSPQPQIKIEASQITVQTSAVGSVKLTSGGVDIGNGAMKIGA
jgi:Type VI secretion system/phage-baseplate injector OB domain